MSPSLSLGPVARSVDQRIENLLVAFRLDGTPEATTVLWALKNWQAARAALEAIAETQPTAEVAEIIREGLEVIEDA